MTPYNYNLLRKDSEFGYFINTLYDIYKVFQSFGNLKSKNEILNLIDQIEKEINILNS